MKNKLRVIGVLNAIIWSLACGVIYAEEDEEDGGGQWVAISGAVEVEIGAALTQPGDPNASDTNESGVTLAAVEIVFGMDIATDVSGEIVLLQEGNDGEDTSFGVVQEANITFGDPEEGFYINMGSMKIPFGVYASNMVSLPLTLEAAEIPAFAVVLGFAEGNLYGSAYIFNGNTFRGDSESDTMEHGGFSLGFADEGYDIGVDYINSMGEGPGFFDGLYGTACAEAQAVAECGGDDEEAYGGQLITNEYVPGIAVHASFDFDNVSIALERVSATKAFDDPAIFGAVTNIEPSLTTIEIGVAFDDSFLGAAIQTTENAVAIGFPETQLLVTYAVEMFHHTSFALEFRNTEDYSIADGGTGDKTTALTALIGIEFE